MKTHLPYLIVIGILLILIIGNRSCDINTSTKTTVTEKVDSTVVDSLEKRIQVLESVPAETIKVEIEVPEPVETGEVTSDGTEIKEYTSVYKDSLITARWVTAVAGDMLNQDFEYVPRAMPVIRETKNIYMTQYRTREVKTVKTRQVGGFLAAGGSFGLTNTNQFAWSAKLRFQTKDGYSYHAEYLSLPTGNAIMGGISIPIRIKLF